MTTTDNQQSHSDQKTDDSWSWRSCREILQEKYGSPEKRFTQEDNLSTHHIMETHKLV